jgi:prolyl-tRNA editing enzyme YbaK/EbsC (Cys-tRNA(Pro) deacylase)
MRFDQLPSLLAEHGADFVIHEHEPVRTVEESRASLPFDVGRYLKTLAFRAGEGRWLLAALRGLDRLDYRRLADAAGVARAAIAAATPQEVQAALGCEPGAVCPVPLRAGVELLVDENAATMDRVFTGAGRSDRTLEIAMADLLRVSGGRVVPLCRAGETR